MNFQPVIKWSGSKRSQSDSIVARIPDKKFDTYYEPFCGGCSILFQLLNNEKSKNFTRFVCSDKNEDLINLWNEIKNNPYGVAKHYNTLWQVLNQDEDLERKKQFFNGVRERLNTFHDPKDFMFIMRTTTNGMPRYNKNGDFNNSFHVTRKGIHPDRLEKIVLQWSHLLNEFDVQFLVQEYDNVQTSTADFIYLDPPYFNTKGMYFGTIDYSKFLLWLGNQDGDYILSYDGKTKGNDQTVDLPKELYSKHEYLESGLSSFRRLHGNNTKVYESLYQKITV